jgi:hypothetical protein
LDLRDRDAAEVARWCISDAPSLQGLVNECEKQGAIPTAIVAVSPEIAAETIGCRFPDLGSELCAQLPEGSFHLIVFAFGGHVHRTHRRRCGCGCG